MDLLERQNQKPNQRHPWELARFSFIKKILNEKLQSNKNAVVDIGCGDGFVTEQLANLFKESEFIGIDIAFKGGESSSINSTKPNLLMGSNKEELLNEKAIDILLLLDVIEHVEDDRALLVDLFTTLKFNKNAMVLITAPAYQWLWSERDQFLKHFRRYNLPHLIKLIEDINSYKIVNRGYFFFSLIFPRAIQCLVEKLKTTKKNNTSIGSWNKGAILTNIIKYALVVDFKFCLFLNKFHIRLPGLSCFVLVQK